MNDGAILSILQIILLKKIDRSILSCCWSYVTKLVLKSVSYPKIVKYTPILIEQSKACNVYTYAAVNWHLELPLLKERQRFDAVSTSNLEVYKFRDWWILTYFIFGHGESSPNNIWSMVNLERTCVLYFHYFFCLRVNGALQMPCMYVWILT